MSDIDSTDGWGEYRRLVVSELDKLNKKTDEIADIKAELAQLRTQVRMGAFLVSAITGTVVAAIVTAVMGLIIK